MKCWQNNSNKLPGIEWMFILKLSMDSKITLLSSTINSEKWEKKKKECFKLYSISDELRRRNLKNIKLTLVTSFTATKMLSMEVLCSPSFLEVWLLRRRKRRKKRKEKRKKRKKLQQLKFSRVSKFSMKKNGHCFTIPLNFIQTMQREIK